MSIISNDIKKRKKTRIKIQSIEDFHVALKKEGYINEDSKCGIANTDKFNIERIFEILKRNDVVYISDNVMNFVDYIEDIALFNEEFTRLKEILTKINKLNISRVEYEREVSIKEDVDSILPKIEYIKSTLSERISGEELKKLSVLENELDNENIYTKDIELLKSIIINKDSEKSVVYDDKTRTKTIYIEVNKEMNWDFIKPKVGSIEYHQHIKSNIPRMKRLRKNIHKYLEVNEKEHKSYHIYQSKILQDTINIAIATFDNKEFKAISGSNDVSGYCVAPNNDNAVFESIKVNKLGHLGVGYKRLFDSEKKIFEEIDRQIKNNQVKNYGELILYSKWEPCPSCYYVIWQFIDKYPNINIKVKYSKKYGEK